MKFDLLKKSVSAALAVVVLAGVGYTLVEPQIVKATSTSDVVVITLNVDEGISISSPPDSSMSPNLGVSSDVSLGSTVWNVKTNDGLGYFLNLKASTAPAMQQNSTSTINDYQTGAPNAWNATSSNAYFGYSAYGTDTSTATWGSGATCGSGSTIPATMKYKGFTTGTSTTNVASRSATTTTTGVNTTVCYAAQQNGFYVPSGTYTATITATAVGN